MSSRKRQKLVNNSSRSLTLIPDGTANRQRRSSGVKAGSLQALKNIPLDIFLEILSNVELADLLALARTNKDLRSILMSRTTISVWRSSRLNTRGLPPLVPSMSEPAFASLIYDFQCYFCPKIARQIIWTSLIRCCKNCLNEKFRSLRDLQLIPNFCLPEYVVALSRYYDYKDGRNSFRRYFVKDVDALSEQYMKIKGNQMVKEAWYLRLVGQRETDAKYVAACIEWDTHRSSERSDELNSLRDSRFKAVIQKLLEMGWANELSNSELVEKLMNHRLVNQPKALSDQSWQAIRPELQIYMQDFKNKRIHLERLNIAKARLTILEKAIGEYEASQLPGVIAPPAIDIALMQPFKSIIEDLPPEEGARPIQLTNACTRQLPQVIKQWHFAKHEELLKELQKHNPEATLADIQLVTTIFACRGSSDCAQALTYPRVLAHACSLERANALEPELKGRLPEWCNAVPWNFGGKRVVFAGNVSRRAAEVVQACGLDPGRTTVGEMIALNPVVECVTCQNSWDGRLVMNWMHAILHKMTQPDGFEHQFSSPSFSPDDLKLVKEKTAQATAQRHIGLGHLATSYFRCRLCNFSGGLPEVKDHIKTRHGRTTVTDQDWKYSPTRAPISELYPPPIRIDGSLGLCRANTESFALRWTNV